MSDFNPNSDESTVAVAEPTVVPRKRKKEQTKPKRQPSYHVILWDDPDHTYEYVMLMMKRLFRMPIEQGYKVAKEVDASGRAICMTTTLELAELKRDQIHAFGRDELLARCKGSMSATIEPAPWADRAFVLVKLEVHPALSDAAKTAITREASRQRVSSVSCCGVFAKVSKELVA